MLLPGETIDFAEFQRQVTKVEDQCARLMRSLEEARRTIETLTAERDHYNQFWQATNNFYSAMSQFQVAETTAVPQISVPSNAPVLSRDGMSGGS